jgi:hypothetical protein
MKMEVLCSSETMGTNNKTTLRHNPEDHFRHNEDVLRGFNENTIQILKSETTS